MINVVNGMTTPPVYQANIKFAINPDMALNADTQVDNHNKYPCSAGEKIIPNHVVT